MNVRISLAIVAFALAASPALATGWNDYELSIGDDLSIVRCNSLEVILWHADELVYSPDQFATTGPINGYIVDGTTVYLRVYGRTARNRFPGDTFENVDTSVQHYLTYDTATRTLDGPMTAAEFEKTIDAATVNWTQPRNPNMWLPIVGMTVFLGVTAVIFGGPLALVVLAAWLVCRIAVRSRLTENAA